jgi:hypothetical protein
MSNGVIETQEHAGDLNSRTRLLPLHPIAWDLRAFEPAIFRDQARDAVGQRPVVPL